MFFYKKLIVVVFFIALMVPSSANAGAACAIGGLLTGGISGLLQKAVAGAIPVNDRRGNANLDIATNKECFLDGLTVKLRETLIQNLTSGIVDWINSGFDGNPTFVTDLNGFLVDTADEAGGEFIEGTELGGLCNPFEVRTLISIEYYSSYEDRTTCTLTEIGGNIDRFKKGYFEDGGWSLFYRLKRDNLYRNLTDTGVRLAEIEAAAVDEQQKLLDQGDGYLGQKECTTGEDGKEECKIVTPGKTIGEQLNNTLSGPLRQLELADELDEIINALLGQLSSKVLGGGGLLNLSKSSGGKSSYTSELTKNKTSNNLDEIKTDTLSYIQSVESTENTYRTTKIETKNILENSESLLSDLIACDATKTISSNILINETIIPLQIEVQEDIDASELILVELNNLKTTILQSNSSSRLQDIIFEVEEMNVHGYIDITRARIEKDETESDMVIIDTETEANLVTCQP